MSKKKKINYKVAERLNLPTNKLLAIEYPGCIQNNNKALKTLGGKAELEKAFNDNKKKFIELKFRPNDPFSHPIYGTVSETSNFVLNVKKKNGKTESKITGVVNNTYRFDGMADFQYMAPNEYPYFDNEETDFFLKHNDEEIHIPPPIFCSSDMPVDYSFKQNVGYKLDPTKSALMSVNEQKNPKLIRIQFGSKIPELIPVKHHISEPEQKIVDKLKELFEQRPIWSKFAVAAQFEKEEPALKKKYIFSTVSFTYSNGPWRNLYVRYGYDPQIIPESKIYQALDSRFPKESLAKNVPTNEYIFKGRETQDIKPVYQLLDIKLDSVQILVHQSEIEECDTQAGWFKKGTLKLVRDEMLLSCGILIQETTSNTQQNEEEDGEPEKQDETQMEIESESDDEIQLPNFDENAFQPYDIFGEDSSDSY